MSWEQHAFIFSSDACAELDLISEVELKQFLSFSGDLRIFFRSPVSGELLVVLPVSRWSPTDTLLSYIDDNEKSRKLLWGFLADNFRCGFEGSYKPINARFEVKTTVGIVINRDLRPKLERFGSFKRIQSSISEMDENIEQGWVGYRWDCNITPKDCARFDPSGDSDNFHKISKGLRAISKVLEKTEHTNFYCCTGVLIGNQWSLDDEYECGNGDHAGTALFVGPAAALVASWCDENGQNEYRSEF